jgi:hypothetical protein
MKKYQRGFGQYFRYSPAANDFAGVLFEDEVEDELVTNLFKEDRSIARQWVVPTCIGFDDNPPLIGDFPSVSNMRSVPMMSHRAWDVLRPLVGDACEVLPVNHPFNDGYYIVHVLQTIDALDVSRCEFDYYEPDDPAIAGILKYAFRDDLVHKQHIFKLPMKHRRELILGEAFRAACEEHSLKGLRFEPLPMAD